MQFREGFRGLSSYAERSLKVLSKAPANFGTVEAEGASRKPRVFRNCIDTVLTICDDLKQKAFTDRHIRQ